MQKIGPVVSSERIVNAEEKLRLAYQVARMLHDYDSSAVMQVWMTGEYVGSIHTIVQDRPLAVEKERINFDEHSL